MNKFARMKRSKDSVSRIKKSKSSEARMSSTRNKLSSEETDELCDARKLFNVVIIFLFLLCLANVAKTRYYEHAISHDTNETRPKKPHEGKIAYVSHIFLSLIETSSKGLIGIYKGLFILCEDLSQIMDELIDDEEIFTKFKIEIFTNNAEFNTSYKGILMFCGVCGFIVFCLNNIRKEIDSLRNVNRFGKVIGLLFLLCLDYFVKPGYYIYICYIFCYIFCYYIYFSFWIGYYWIGYYWVVAEQRLQNIENFDNLVTDKVLGIENLMAQKERNFNKQVQERIENLRALEKKNMDELVQERALEKKNMHNDFVQKQIEFLEGQIESISLSLECPVCLETASSPIYQCQESHLICGKCRPRLRACPECRLPYAGKPQRNRYAENDSHKMEKLKKEKLDLIETLDV